MLARKGFTLEIILCLSPMVLSPFGKYNKATEQYSILFQFSLHGDEIEVTDVILNILIKR